MSCDCGCTFDPLNLEGASSVASLTCEQLTPIRHKLQVNLMKAALCSSVWVQVGDERQDLASYVRGIKEVLSYIDSVCPSIDDSAAIHFNGPTRICRSCE